MVPTAAGAYSISAAARGEGPGHNRLKVRAYVASHGIASHRHSSSFADPNPNPNPTLVSSVAEEYLQMRALLSYAGDLVAPQVPHPSAGGVSKVTTEQPLPSPTHLPPIYLPTYLTIYQPI